MPDEYSDAKVSSSQCVHAVKLPMVLLLINVKKWVVTVAYIIVLSKATSNYTQIMRKLLR